MSHILCGCPIALGQGRYRWRHVQVLKEVAHHVGEKRKENNSPRTRVPQIEFVKAGERRQKTKQKGKKTRSYLDGAADWRIKFQDNVAHIMVFCTNENL